MVETKKEDAYKFRRHVKLTGIRSLKGKDEGRTAVIWCSGPTFSSYDDSEIPDDWVRFSINETIKRNWDGWDGRNPEYWVLSDLPVVEKFAKHCPTDSTILAMHRATETINRVCPKNKIYTVNSMPDTHIKTFDNGYEFFSRRTVMIGAVEMARYMGFKRFFVFGLDLFRLPSKYYYDGTDAIWMGERRSPQQFMIRTPGVKHDGQRIYQTPNLRAARMMLNEVKKAKLWSDIDIHVVGSPHSQQDTVPKMDRNTFDDVLDIEARKPGRDAGSKTRKKVIVDVTKEEPVPLTVNLEDVAKKIE